MASGVRVDQFRELGKDLHHLVGALTTGGHHDYLGVALLGDGVLQHGLAAAERARDEAGTAFGNRVEGIHTADARLHNAIRTGFLHVAAHSHFHGPFLHHRDLVLLALRVGEHGHRIVDLVIAFLRHGFHGVAVLERERNHNLVRQPAFLYLAEPVGGVNGVARLREGREVPDLVVVERGGVFAAFEEDVFHRGKVVLQAVVTAGKQARAQLNLEHMAFELHFVALAQVAGAFVHLHERVFARHLDDLGHQFRTGQVDVADFVLRHVAFETHRHQVGDDTGNYTCCFHYLYFIIVQR